MSEPRTELQLRMILEMESYQLRHALAKLIKEFEDEGDVIDMALVAAYDMDNPDSDSEPDPKPDMARGGFVGEHGPEALVPLGFGAGTLHIPAIMWTNDGRDTPKMIVETLCVVQTAMSVYAKHTEVSPEYLERHNDRIERLIESAQRGVQ